jgi:hypothetical protein
MDKEKYIKRLVLACAAVIVLVMILSTIPSCNLFAQIGTNFNPYGQNVEFTQFQNDVVRLLHGILYLLFGILISR